MLQSGAKIPATVRLEKKSNDTNIDGAAAENAIWCPTESVRVVIQDVRVLQRVDQSVNWGLFKEIFGLLHHRITKQMASIYCLCKWVECHIVFAAKS